MASTSTMGTTTTSGGILSGDDAFVRLASTMGAGNGTSRVKGVTLEDVVRGADGPPRMFSPTTTRGGEAASSLYQHSYCPLLHHECWQLETVTWFST